MGLKEELGLKQPIVHLSNEALLNIYYTASCLKKRADEFFRPYGLTDVQFNLLMLLKYHSNSDGGLTQARISEMMLVNRANITSLIDRMERANLVRRTPSSKDRRYNIIKMTSWGKKVLNKVEDPYFEEVRRIMSALSEPEQQKLVEILGKVRANIRRHLSLT